MRVCSYKNTTSSYSDCHSLNILNGNWFLAKI
ncbi:Hypothetical protein FNO222_0741 [Francisella orientalis]|uniref:Uncharacterized protein n=1 Tax=Francisella orientalis TaxID=299583 RepID=A0ABM5U657_9GAMM|nr:hypothetical protein FNO12_0737 [Francisella orientalis FNO12]AKN86973.1 Hypothetical protein FNO24_0737 [Francisella orientalis FNO24]AKN88511.1 Hypothetical protein FNO190_0737 [Francisella orientalis]AKU05267.1 Hypothetical protein FNO01_0737 [Francisella orientalis]QEN20177.1 Hypothetical protein FNO39_0741 [Francisella orientalis]